MSRGEDRRAQGGVPQRKAADARTSPAEDVRHAAARFLPVRVVMDRASQPGSGVEIRWENGRTVRLYRGFDPQTLAEVLSLVLWGIDLGSVKRQERYALAR